MKKFVLDFIHRGLMACGFGPIVLAVVYLVLQKCAVVETLMVDQMCTGIFTITALAFIAGGMNAVYQIERLPFMWAILIHGIVLYGGYLATYLLNDWLEQGIAPIAVFTGIFAVGYLVVWLIIYSVIKRNTNTLNGMLKKKQHSGEAVTQSDC